MKILVEKCKCAIEIKDYNNCTPIFYAATLGQEEAVKLLLKYGVKLDVQDIKGRTVFHSAAAKGQLKCLKLLCEKDATIWLRNRKGDYPVHEAYYNKQMDCVYYLLDTIKEKKAIKSVNQIDGRSLLHLAAAENDVKLCKKLVSSGADVNPLMRTALVKYNFLLIIFFPFLIYFFIFLLFLLLYL
jgi:ankyrin repeat protein